MSRAIWKFVLKAQETQHVVMPRGATIFSVGNQFENICVWAEVDTQAEKVNRRIAVVPTGMTWEDGDMPPSTALVGHVMLQGGALVFHVFDCGESPKQEAPHA